MVSLLAALRCWPAARHTHAQAQSPYSGSMGCPSPRRVAQSAGPGVQCAPNQQATMARVLVNGQELMTLACVDRVNDGMAYYQPAQPMMAAPMAYAQPVSYVPVQQAPAPRWFGPVPRPVA